MKWLALALLLLLPGAAGAEQAGSNPVAAVATGGNTSRSLAAHFSDELDAKDFGAIFDGSSHPLSSKYATLAAAQVVYPFALSLTEELDGDAIQSALNYCATLSSNSGGACTVYVPNGKGYSNIGLTIGNINVSLKSRGAGINIRSNVGATTPSAPTTLVWNGAARSPGQANVHMMTVSPAGTRLLSGTNVEGILFNCNAIAGCSGPLVQSARFFTMDVGTYEPSGVAYPSSTVTSGSQTITVSDTTGIAVGEAVTGANIANGAYVASVVDGTHITASVQASASGTQTVYIGGTGLRFDVLGGLSDSNDTQNFQLAFQGMALQGGVNATPPLVMMGGSGAAASGGTHYGNTSVSTIRNIRCVINNGDCLALNNTDHLIFQNVSAQTIGGGNGRVITSNGTLDANNGAARYNVFQVVGGVGGEYFAGTDTGGFTSASVDNIITALQVGNGAVAPTGGTNAVFGYATDLNPQIVWSSGYAPGQTIGGQNPGANGIRSVTLGGTNLQTNAEGSVAFGTSTNALTINAICGGSGAVVSGRPNQQCTQLLRVASGTDTTPVRLFATGSSATSSNCVNLTFANSAYNLSIQLIAIDETTPGNIYVWTQPAALLWRGATASTSNYADVGTPIIGGQGTTTGITVSQTADTTQACLNTTFTPPTGNTHVWSASETVRWTETHAP
jgi:hypothetical protein